MDTLAQTIANLNLSDISETRKKELQAFAHFIAEKRNKNEQINLNFICTHNSRRSHLSQIWMQTLAHHFGIENLTCYSGGTEATAIATPIIRTLEKQGFQIEKLSKESNPLYAIKYTNNSHPILAFSKEYAHNFNPSSDFTAIMTCSQADDGCPLIAGCERRIALTYEDPKLYDHTELEEEKYTERSVQIATEFYYLLNLIS